MTEALDRIRAMLGLSKDSEVNRVEYGSETR